MVTTARKYDKGERRKKHVGKENYPTIEIDRGNPKRFVGKCPKNLSQGDIDRLLVDAIEGPRGDRDLDYAKRLYVVHEGAIYEAQTSDRGRSYHGYPYKGNLPSTVVDELRSMAAKKHCLADFEDWVKRNIGRHGTRR